MNEFIKKLKNLRNNLGLEKRPSSCYTNHKDSLSSKSFKDADSEFIDIATIITCRKNVKASLMFYKAALQTGSISAISPTIVSILECLIPLQPIILKAFYFENHFNDEANNNFSRLSITPKLESMLSFVSTEEYNFRVTKQLVICCWQFLNNLVRFIYHGDILILNKLIEMNISNEINGPKNPFIKDKKKI